MKEQLLETVSGLMEDGIDLKENHPLFIWTYEELPNIEFQLLIKEVEKEVVH